MMKPAQSARLAEIIGDLVRIPSENKPPIGSEQACQDYIANFLRRLDWTPSQYQPDTVDGIQQHPLFWPGRNYTGRPNLIARKRGSGGGKSLLLSGHIDTVPKGTFNWTRDPFGGTVEGDKLYGRGSNDMKGGIGISLFVLEQLADQNLAGDLLFETVADEEFGGSNGTLAGRLAGHNADAAIITEPSFLRVCPAQRGGRTAHITLRGPGGGVLSSGGFPRGVLPALTCFLNALEDFQNTRRQTAPQHVSFASCPDTVPVSITKIHTGPWGTGEPINVPEECQIELYWQTMPGESQDAIEQQFFDWLDSHFTPRPSVEFPMRWLPGSAIDHNHPLVQTLSKHAKATLGRRPEIAGIEGPCDMFIFHEFGIPAVLWGPRGANTHAADEYVDLPSTEQAAETLLSFIQDWCK
jgi:acetylornithine deacetylase